MELNIFKNRPTPNIDINEVDDNQALEIVRRMETGTVSGRIRISKVTCIQLANGLREYLRTYNAVHLRNDFDQIEIHGGGFEYDPSVLIHIKHKNADEKFEGLASHFSEAEAEILAKALERWAKHPNL